jgi:signal transduction histidine kinase
LQLIAQVAEQSLAELRDGLESLEAGDAPLEPSRLAAIGRRAGVDVSISSGPIPPGAAAVLAHRVIREAIVNTARHAPGAAASIRIEQRAGAIHLEVTDDGSDAPSTVVGTGRGLLGLAEAITAGGGSFDSGPVPDGGFRIAATIPQGVS